MKQTTLPRRALATDTISYIGSRFSPDVISYAEWLYYRFSVSFRAVEELLAAHGIGAMYKMVQRWSVKVGFRVSRHIRSAALARSNKWLLAKWSSRSARTSPGYGVQWSNMAHPVVPGKAGVTGTRPSA